MAVPTFTLVVDLDQIVGTPVASARLTIDTNFGSDAVAYAGADGIRVVGGKHPLTGGSGSFTLPVTSHPTANPTSFQYVVTAEASMPGVPPRTIGPIYVTGTSGATVYLSDCMAATLVPADWRDGFRDEIEGITSAAVADTAAIRDEVAGYVIGELGTTDSQAASLISTPGTLTGGALNAAYASLAAAHETSTDFTTMPDGPWEKASTGQRVTSYPRTGNAFHPYIENGRLLCAPATPAPIFCYSSIPLGGEATRVGARFSFDAYTTGDTGGVCVAATVGEIGASYEASAGVPAMPCHVVITPTSWSFDTFPGGSGGISTVQNGLFPTPLPSGVEHSVEVVVDSTTGAAVLYLPDGQVISLRDDRIKVDGATWAFVQHVRNSAGDPVARVRAMWADSRRSADPILESLALARALEPEAPVASVVFPATDASVALGPTETHIASVSGARVPMSGKVLVTMSAYVDITTAGLLFFVLRRDGVPSPLAWLSAGTKVGASQVTIPWVIDSTPTAVLDLSFSAVMVSGAATLKLHAGGEDAFVASLTAIPLP